MNRLAIGALLLLPLGLTACDTPPAATMRCVSQGQAYPGRCPTQCESHCALLGSASCTGDAAASTPDSTFSTSQCLSDCEAFEGNLDVKCLDARYVYWRCLRRRGLPEVGCQDGLPGFGAVPADVCVSERSDRDRQCPPTLEPDSGSPSDAGDLPADGSPPSDAALPDADGAPKT